MPDQPKPFTTQGAELLAGLGLHTGTMDYYKHWSRRFVYTEGVKFLVDKAQAYWLIDLIASHQTRTVRSQAPEFQFWTLYVREGGHSLKYPGRVNDVYLPQPYHAVAVCTDGDCSSPVVSQRIHYTDFPLSRIDLRLKLGSLDGTTPTWVLMLPSED